MNTVCVLETDKDWEALHAKELLEADGIVCQLRNLDAQNLVSYMKALSGSDPIAGPIQVLVLENDAEQAFDLLERFFKPDATENGTDAVNEVQEGIEASVGLGGPVETMPAGLELDPAHKELAGLIAKAVILTFLSAAILPAVFLVPVLAALAKRSRALFTAFLAAGILVIGGALIAIFLVYGYFADIMLTNTFLVPFLLLLTGISGYTRHGKAAWLLLTLPFVAVVLMFFSMLVQGA